MSTNRDLYTDQVHLKRLLAGQATAAFTPLSLDTTKFIDPAFVPGMGALMERPEDGALRCPVKGCGQWVLKLAYHVAKKHQNIGGVTAVRRALSIPCSVSLLSSRVVAERRSRVGARYADRGEDLNRWRAGGGRSNRNGNGRLGSGTTVSQRNFADTCPAQLREKLTALDRKLGHSPSVTEFTREFGVKAANAVKRVFGSWNAAKTECGLDSNTPSSWRGERRHNFKSPASVTAAFQLFYERNGDLPRSGSHETRGPRVPDYRVTCRATGADNWNAAMRSVGESLGIKSERYGFDFRKSRVA